MYQIIKVIKIIQLSRSLTLSLKLITLVIRIFFPSVITDFYIDEAYREAESSWKTSWRLYSSIFDFGIGIDIP